MGTLRVVQALPIITAVSALMLPSDTWAAAQVQDSFAAPAHVDFLEGQASLEREGQIEPADVGAPFIPGDRLRTTTGRVEVIFPDGSILDIDEYSSVDLQDITLLRLTSGQLLLTVAGADDPASAMLYQIDTPVASVTTEGPGEYRVAVLSNPTGLVTELAVSRGAASLSTELGSTPLRAGQRSLARELEGPTHPQVFNSARLDAFDEWAAEQREARLGTPGSSQYLPAELQMYSGTLDRSGSWISDPSYGYVWYPAVGATWRPYYSGYWRAIRPYGWTWIGADPWAWPTHHYGRWGYRGSRWYWIPNNRWGPAWVSWGVSVGHVGWSPLGFDNRPLFSLSVSIGRHWNGWVVVPSGYFHASRTLVRHHVIPPYRLRAETFVTQAVAPIAPRYAVPRQRGGVADTGVARARAESAAVPADGIARRPATAIGRRPLALSRPAGTASRSRTSAPTSAARTVGDAAQRNPRSAVRVGSSVRGSSARESVRRPAATTRQQPATRTGPIEGAPRVSITQSPRVAGTTSGSGSRLPRTAVQRIPRAAGDGRTAAPSPATSSLGRPQSSAADRDPRLSPSGGTRPRASAARAAPGRSRQPVPPAVAPRPIGNARGSSSGSSQPARASGPSASSRGAMTPQAGPRGASPRTNSRPTPQQAGQPGARARAPGAEARSGGRTSVPARAISRRPEQNSGTAAPSGSRAQPSGRSTPGRVPAARRAR